MASVSIPLTWLCACVHIRLTLGESSGCSAPRNVRSLLLPCLKPWIQHTGFPAQASTVKMGPMQVMVASGSELASRQWPILLSSWVASDATCFQGSHWYKNERPTDTPDRTPQGSMGTQNARPLNTHSFIILWPTVLLASLPPLVGEFRTHLQWTNPQYGSPFYTFFRDGIFIFPSLA
jgi:hypothetical protein